MKTIADIRRENAREVIDRHGGVSKVAKAMGYANASFLVQQAGPRPSRNVTETTARKIEEALGLPAGQLDIEKSATGATGPAMDALSISNLADVIRLVGKTMKDEGLPHAEPQKFADVVAIAVTDALEHGGQARPEHIRMLVALLK